MRGTSRTHSRTCSRTHSRSRSRSRRRSHSRTCSQSHDQSDSWSRCPRSPTGPPPGRRVTFRELEVEPNFKGGVEDYLPEPSVSDVETWLEWKGYQLGIPAWKSELTAILGIKDLQKLARKIWASCYIPKARMRTFLEQEYTAPPAPKCFNRNTFLLDELSYQDIWQQPTLLAVAYARGLQYLMEKLNLPESLDLHPLAGSVVELRETVWERVTFTNWVVVWGLGAIHLGSTSQWPQTTLFSHVLSLLVEGQDFMETTTHTTSPIAGEEVARCITSHLEQNERTGTCWSLLPL